MRRLWLLRHAKSSWDEPALDDHERPLAARGTAAAEAMAAHLRKVGATPDLVLCSSAVRARDTLTGVLPGLGPDLKIVVDRSLYTFESRALADALAHATDKAEGVLMVGHNPANPWARGTAGRLRRGPGPAPYEVPHLRARDARSHDRDVVGPADRVRRAHRVRDAGRPPLRLRRGTGAASGRARPDEPIAVELLSRRRCRRVPGARRTVGVLGDPSPSESSQSP